MRRERLCFGLALVMGCQEPLPSFLDGEPATNSDEFFSLDHVPRVHVELDDTAWDALVIEPKLWVHGEFRYEDTTIGDVGVRLKGNHSLRPLTDKPSFKIKFNEYVSGQRFLGLETLNLNNMVVDSSMSHEWLSYRVFRALGVPAPRAGYAEVVVNDQLYGLYLSLEEYDDEFLEDHYADADGNLYEAENGADLDTNVDAWDQDEGSDKSRDDLVALQELATRDDDAVFYGPEAAIDLPEFHAFMAGETIIGHFDGHVAGHNFFIYHEPTADAWSWLPWGLDQTLIRRVTPYEHEGFLADKCLHEERCMVDYVLASQQALDAFRDLDLDADLDRIAALTEAAVAADTRRPYDVDAVNRGRDNARAWLAGREAELRPSLECLVDGVQPDADEDGYGPCFQDCDETNAAINPDATEACDGIDNDCTGFVDDDPSCECPSVQVGTRTFFLCKNDLTWYEARDYCAEQGRVLARFESIDELAPVQAAADELDSGAWAMGLNDRAVENEFVWLDGSAPSFTAWAPGEPSHQLDWFDCGFLNGAVWWERNCIEQGSFICTDD